MLGRMYFLNSPTENSKVQMFITVCHGHLRRNLQFLRWNLDLRWVGFSVLTILTRIVSLIVPHLSYIFFEGGGSLPFAIL
jgi:hypothetical protein